MGKLPCPFWVNRVEGLSVNDSAALTLDDLLCCDVNDPEEVWSYVLLANYIVDTDWLVHAAPSLLQTKHLLCIISGEKGYAKNVQSSSLFERMNPDKIRIVEPKLPLPFGVHHSKLALCVNAKGIRVAVFTANFIHEDWAYKTQGIYVQDFPRFPTLFKSAQANTTYSDGITNRGNRFKSELLRYLNHYGIFSNFKGKVSIPISMFDEINFDSVSVDIIASIPGYHRYSDINSYGLGRIPRVLQDIGVESSDGRHVTSLIWQFSSQGKLTDSFLIALKNAMSEGEGNKEANKKHLCHVQIVYPTESEVKESFEGWRGGIALPLRLSSCHPFINERLHRWGQRNRGYCAKGSLRRRALPHIKTYMCLTEKKDGIKWCILTSANLSRAAWGEWQKNETQLAIRSYEFGIVYGKDSCIQFLEGKPFSITPSKPIPIPSLVEHDGLVEVHIDPGEKQKITEGPVLFLPYDPLHLEPYTSTVQMREQKGNMCEAQLNTNDIPWVIDLPHLGKDIFGNELLSAMECGGTCGNTIPGISRNEGSEHKMRLVKRQRPE
ncbi:putative tyrosyl-DNA Phosphodiesterase (Tdp1) [Trypanosoma rangeli]|uniref:Putative tyrosyl-DNA Phosphodiesterase (Tdp1) n=1 Tax=Trypanosoma rangeli TaxID=5698 RepID=A0A3R7RCR4_TRYRA|nr:putative tyrosyl-DNA Phosphodiesterase (Tdp1) [Trypanosoma rangeli]RNE99891.1 putative tyrosyl-DNA Phosphodiesterase (Tdp1) [Trypanosoma rangeli]|eukprot:RNE99891.1 putative tyrosyl-DNA Phosphodiesterase (Tdp1) [Trypanosoma rangeli]